MTVALVCGAGWLGAAACVVRARHVNGREAGTAHRGRRGRAPARVAAWWEAQLGDAGVEGSPAQWARVAVGVAGVAVGGGAVRGGITGAIAAVAVTAAAALLARHMCRGRGDRRADARLPDLLEHAARHLRGGRDLPTSLRLAADAVGGPHGSEMRAATDRVDGGAGLVAALGPWESSHPRPAVRLTVGALAVAAATGGASAQALDAVASTLRSSRAVADEARALASQARASAAVLIALPVLVVVVGSAADARVAHSVLATPLGLLCLAGATVLDGTGAWWMQRIVADAG